MTTHTYPGENWSAQLAALLERARDGDVITVPSDVAKELVEHAAKRMGLTVTVLLSSPPR